MTLDFWMNALSRKDPLIKVQGNWRCRIENINVTLASVPTVMLGACNTDDTITYSEMKLPKKQKVYTTYERSVLLNKKLEQFIKLTKTSNTRPVIRYMGLYSALCTHWEKSNTTDIANLEMDERNLMRDLIKIGCDVRVLINLDIQKALFCGYSIENIQKRVADLCSACDELKDYKNFSLAIDNTLTSEPILILGSILANHNYNYNGMEGEKYKGNYRCAVWSSDHNEILELSANFDSHYISCIGMNRALMSLLSMDSYSQLIYYIVMKKIMEENL